MDKQDLRFRLLYLWALIAIGFIIIGGVCLGIAQDRLSVVPDMADTWYNTTCLITDSKYQGSPTKGNGNRAVFEVNFRSIKICRSPSTTPTGTWSPTRLHSPTRGTLDLTATSITGLTMTSTAMGWGGSTTASRIRWGGGLFVRSKGDSDYDDVSKYTVKLGRFSLVDYKKEDLDALEKAYSGMYGSGIAFLVLTSTGIFACDAAVLPLICFSVTFYFYWKGRPAETEDAPKKKKTSIPTSKKLPCKNKCGQRG